MELYLRVFGLLFLAAAALTLTGALLAAVYAIGRRNRRLLRHAGIVAGSAVAAHAALILAGPRLMEARVLPPGAELAFCGFDCHLHVSAKRGTSPEQVVVRFRSDAKAVPEHPGGLRIRGYDEHGNAYPPIAAIPDIPLLAGDTVERIVLFAPADGLRIERIGLTWRDWESYLVPGPENPLVQRRRSLALGDSAAARERGS